MAVTLDQLVVRLEADIKGLKAGLSQARGEVQRFSGDSVRETDRFTAALGRAKVAAGITAAALAAIGATKSLFQAGSQIESLNGKMQAAVGNAQAARESLAWLGEESERLGLRFLNTSDSFASFAAASTRAGLTLQQTREVFLGVSEAAVAFRLSNERVQLVFQALSQIAAKGVVSMEELRQQLGESLPIAMEAAARGMGVTQAQLIDMVSKGEVASKDFLPAFGQAIRENLGDAVDIASRSGQASMNRLANAIDRLKATVAEGAFMRNLAAAFDALTVAVSTPALHNALKGIAWLISKIVQVAAEAVAGIAMMVQGLVNLANKARSMLGLGGDAVAAEPTSEPTTEAGSYTPSAGGGVNKAAEKAMSQRQTMLDGLRSQIDGIKYDNASPADKLKIDMEEELAVLREGLENKLLTEQEFRELSLEAEAKYQGHLGEIRQKEANEEERRQKELDDAKRAIQEKGVNAALGILGIFASKNKAFAIAMIAIEKARAIQSVLVTGMEAGMLATRNALLTGMPAPLAQAQGAAVVAQSRMVAGLIAAQGFAEAAMGLGKGSGGGGTSGEGGYGVSSFTGSSPAQQTQSKQVFINLEGQGELFTKNQLRSLIDQLNDAFSDGSQLKVVYA